MPIISSFFGIVVYMYWRDHAPPHFHAKYQDQEVVIDIQNGTVTGEMSRRALALIQEWRQLHKEELLDNWRRAETGKSMEPVPPLE